MLPIYKKQYLLSGYCICNEGFFEGAVMIPVEIWKQLTLVKRGAPAHQ